MVLGGGLVIGGAYEAGAFGTGSLGVANYAGVNVLYGAGTSGGLNITEQELEYGNINWGNVGKSTALGGGFGLLSTGAGVWSVSLNDTVNELGNTAASMNGVRDVGVYSQAEIDQANNVVDQAAVNANYLTGAIGQTDNFISPSIQSSLEGLLEPERDPLSSQKATWK